MSKKQYQKPVLIDLSIEGMTGAGAGVMAAGCNTGIHADVVTCLATGEGASGTCTPMGNSPSSSCSGGTHPYESSTICTSGEGAANNCASGGNAAGKRNYCSNGSGATNACGGGEHGSDNKQWCYELGSANAATCMTGDNQLSQS
jgi:hypothetical protein